MERLPLLGRGIYPIVQFNFVLSCVYVPITAKTKRGRKELFVDQFCALSY